MRSGGEYFSEPAEAAQRRYEALRYYFVEEARAEQVAARFGYSPATVHQLAAELRAGRTSFFRSTKPGPKGPRKTRTVRDRVLVLRAEDQSVTEIANALTAQGSPVSAQTVWAILKSEGLERLERRRPAGPAPRLEPAKAKAIGHWPTGARYDCDHAGLYLLLPGVVAVVAGPGWPVPDGLGLGRLQPGRWASRSAPFQALQAFGLQDGPHCLGRHRAALCGQGVGDLGHGLVLGPQDQHTVTDGPGLAGAFGAGFGGAEEAGPPGPQLGG